MFKSINVKVRTNNTETVSYNTGSCPFITIMTRYYGLATWTCVIWACKLQGCTFIEIQLTKLINQSDVRPKSEPALELHSRAASSVGVTSLFQQSQHRKQFQRKADNSKKSGALNAVTVFGHFHTNKKTLG